MCHILPNGPYYHVCHLLQAPLPLLQVFLVTQPGSLASTLQLKEPTNVVDGRSTLDSDKQGHPCAGIQVGPCLSMPQNTEWQS